MDEELTERSGHEHGARKSGAKRAKYWLAVLTQINNRGVQNVCIAACDGLKDLPEAITTTWELAQAHITAEATA